MPRSGRRRCAPAVFAACLLSLSSTACHSARYLLHVGAGQARLLLDRELLTPELEERLSEQERTGVEALRRARAFAERIGLKASSSHRHIVDREGAQPLVTVVTAAPRDRLEPLTWWFPIVGRVSYRGYFDSELAQGFARSLERRGFDTYLRPAVLYSTLGWFDDPVPRELLSSQPFDIADAILHERVHETIFVPGDVSYNEGIAVFIAHEGVLEMLAEDPEERAAAGRAFRDDERFAAFVAELTTELEALYARGLSGDALQEARVRIFDRHATRRFAAVVWETRRYDGVQSAELSNAWVVAHQAYLDDLPCFEAERRLHEDLASFVRAHRESPGHRTVDEACALEAVGRPR